MSQMWGGLDMLLGGGGGGKVSKDAVSVWLCEKKKKVRLFRGVWVTIRKKGKKGGNPCFRAY